LLAAFPNEYTSGGGAKSIGTPDAAALLNVLAGRSQRETKREAIMSPLAEIIYENLRRRATLHDPRITYAELAEQVREAGDEFEYVHHRNRQLYAALAEVGAECRRRKLPPLPALVVRADTGRPGEAYYQGKCGGSVYRDNRIAAWRQDLEAVKGTSYPAL
jgi:hypothetical protein